jgi:hypothetical protein
MTHPLRLMLIAATALALSACAGRPYHEEEPHHFSKDARGNRIACYATDVAKEYDCVPVVRRYSYYDPYYYDPFWPHWSVGFYYGVPWYWYGHHHHYYVHQPHHGRWARRAR